MAGPNKEKWLHARLNDAEANALQALAEEHGITRSALVVALIRTAIGETPGPLALYTNGLTELIFQMRKLGLNMNQIAHAANTPNRTIVLDKVVHEELKAAVHDIVEWLMLTREVNRSRYVKPCPEPRAASSRIKNR